MRSGDINQGGYACVFERAVVRACDGVEGPAGGAACAGGGDSGWRIAGGGASRVAIHTGPSHPWLPSARSAAN